MQQIADWLKTLGLTQYAQAFADNDIDFSVLGYLTDQDLEKIGVSLGHRRKILAAISGLVGAVPAAPKLALTEGKPQDAKTLHYGLASRRMITWSRSGGSVLRRDKARFWFPCCRKDLTTHGTSETTQKPPTGKLETLCFTFALK